MADLAGVVDDGEVRFQAWLLGSEELWMTALLRGQLLYKRAVCCPGKPALLIQQGQNTRRVSLKGNGRSESHRVHLLFTV